MEDKKFKDLLEVMSSDISRRGHRKEVKLYEEINWEQEENRASLNKTLKKSKRKNQNVN